MTQIQAMAWKEWRETRVFLWITLGIFVCLPMIGATQQYFAYGHRHFQYFSADWVYYFGGVIAIFVAVGSTCRDLNGRLEDFWRSRPVSEMRWMLMKYVIGLMVVVFACSLPLLIEFSLERDKDALTMAVWFPFVLVAIYSLAFAAGSLLHRTAHAAMVALAALLLIYYLPTVLPPLRGIDFPSLRNTISDYEDWNRMLFIPAAFEFAAGMLGIALAALGLALLAVRYDWHIESGQKLIYGSISLALLILFASAAYRLGTNLPILQQVNFPEAENVQDVYWKGGKGYLITYKWRFNDATNKIEEMFDIRKIHLAPAGVGLDTKTQQVPISSLEWARLTQQQVSIEYRIDQSGSNLILVLDDFQKQTSKTVATLWPALKHEIWPRTYEWNRQLYVIGRRLIVFDISKPAKLRKISDQPFNDYWRTSHNWDGNEEIFPLADIPGLPTAQRLDLAFRYPDDLVREGNTVCTERNGVLREYRLTSLSPNLAKFALIGQYKWTFLERYMYNGWRSEMKMARGLLYFSQNSVYLSPHIVVFDTRGPKPLQIVGHFSIPAENMFFIPMNDSAHRIIVVGNGKIWLVGPPPRTNQ